MMYANYIAGSAEVFRADAYIANYGTTMRAITLSSDLAVDRRAECHRGRWAVPTLRLRVRAGP